MAPMIVERTNRAGTNSLWGGERVLTVRRTRDNSQHVDQKSDDIVPANEVSVVEQWSNVLLTTVWRSI